VQAVLARQCTVRRCSTVHPAGPRSHYATAPSAPIFYAQRARCAHRPSDNATIVRTPSNTCVASIQQMCFFPATLRASKEGHAVVVYCFPQLFQCVSTCSDQEIPWHHWCIPYRMATDKNDPQWKGSSVKPTKAG